MARRLLKGIAFLITAALGSVAALPAQARDVSVLVQGSAFHGVHGLGIDKAGRLYAGSVIGATLYEVNPAKGTTKVLIPAPEGMADDIAFAPDGTMAWTGFLTGDIYARKGDGPIKKLATSLPGINSLAYRRDGRLYATQVFLGDALYEIDATGDKPPRKIMENMGGLNGFEFGPDDKLYGPLWFKGQIARVDVDTAELSVVADGFKVPAAVNFDSKGQLWVVDTARGQLMRLDPATGAREMVAQLKPGLDNLAIDAKDRIYVSNMDDNGIQEINPATGAVRQVIIGKLAMPGGLALTTDHGKDTLLVADVFSYRSVNTATGAVTDRIRMHDEKATLEYPISVTTRDDEVILSSWFTGTVQLVDRATSASRDIMHGFKQPHDAIRTRDGRLLVSEFGTGSIINVSGEHGKDRTAIATGLQGPIGLVEDRDGALFVTEAMAGQVTKIDGNGNKTVLARDFNMPEGLARAADGTLIVADVGNKRLVSVNPVDGAMTTIADKLAIGMPAIPGGLPTYIPTGVAVGSDGAIYVSSDIENAIYKISAH